MGKDKKKKLNKGMEKDKNAEMRKEKREKMEKAETSEDSETMGKVERKKAKKALKAEMRKEKLAKANNKETGLEKANDNDNGTGEKETGVEKANDNDNETGEKETGVEKANDKEIGEEKANDNESGKKEKAMEKSSTTVEYSYDRDKKRWNLKATQEPIISFPANEFTIHSSQFEHSTLLRRRTVDVKNNLLICDSYDSTLKKTLPPMKKIRTYTIEPLADLKGESKLTIRLLDPKLRSILLEMVELVCYLHTKNASLQPFSLKDWGYKGSKLKLLNVGTFNATVTSRNADFKCIAKVIREILPVEESSFPYLLKHFIKLAEDVNMKFRFPLEERVMLYHLALLPPTQVLSFLRNLSGSVTVSKLNSIHLNWNCLPEADDWIRKSRLEEVITGCANLCFKNGVYTQKVGHFAKADLIQCARNLGIHLIEYMQPSGSWDFDLEMEQTIMRVFEVQLAAFHKDVVQTNLFGRLFP